MLMMTLKIKVLCVDDDRENKVLCNNDDDDYVSKNALQISRLYHFSNFLIELPLPVFRFE